MVLWGVQQGGRARERWQENTVRKGKLRIQRPVRQVVSNERLEHNYNNILLSFIVLRPQHVVFIRCVFLVLL